jgi:arylsulfatase A-like enzyme
MFQKFSLYEASIRVPFIVSTLGSELQVPKGVFDETHFVSGVDLVPTVCDYAGIEPPEDVRGMSLRPLVEGQDVLWREFAFVESNYWGRALIFDRYKYVCEYVPYGNEDDLLPPGPDPERIGLEQIFNLQEDPGETKNLAYEDDRRELVMQFRKMLFDFESGLKRRRIVEEGPVQVIHRWGQRIREHWDAHPELEEMRIRL